MVRILVLLPRVRRDAGARVVLFNVQVQARDRQFCGIYKQFNIFNIYKVIMEMKKNLIKIAAVAAIMTIVGCGDPTTPTERAMNDYFESCEEVLSVHSSDGAHYEIAGRHVQQVNSLVEMMDNEGEYHRTTRYIVAKSDGDWEIVKCWDEAAEIAKADSVEWAKRGEIVNNL